MNSKPAIAIALLGMNLGIWAAQGHGGEPEFKPGSSSTFDVDKSPIPAPEFAEVTTWVNSKPLKLAAQKGKVVVVHFWTNGCINCIHNYPHYRAWTEQYKANRDLVIVGIHTPEFDAERDVSRIEDRAAKNHLAFAIAVDNEEANWKAWGNQFWPSIYVVDKAGNVRYRWIGELGDGGYKEVTGQIDKRLAAVAAGGIKSTSHSHGRHPHDS